MRGGPSSLQPEITLRPGGGWVFLDLESVWKYRDLLTLLVRRDFVARYKQTILGPLWFIIQPLMMTAVFTVIFGLIAGLSTDGMPPVLFYLCNQLGWNYFAQNVAATSTIFVSNGGLFSKVYFPRLVVPLASALSNVIPLLIQTGTFFCALFYYHNVVGDMRTPAIGVLIVLLPLLILHIGALSLGVGLMMSALTAKYRDLTHLSTLMIQVWMYLTPVIYPLSQFPQRWRWVAALNPMTPVIESFRVVLLGVGTVDPLYYVSSVIVTALLLGVSLMVFTKVERTFVDVV